nr:probable LRR receptor-like serine/threonine-protein kinase At2g16250 isoform X1 [Coffea arabica]XP_027080215.1 probable LRR receptor-like serine/threonine-protein kinase At2g16250 isoform X1 [Coffea arabica]
MSRIYDNWERLVGATLLREELRLIAQRTPSDLSLASSIPSPPPSPSPSPSSLARSSFTYDEILQATDNFSSSNLIMYARTGDLFWGALDAGIRVVVKKVDLSLINRISFMQELEFYNKVSHPRFVPLLGHCLENDNHKFLVYKYMPHMDLHSFWFRNVVPFYRGKNLDWLKWETRLKIARGIAEGLCYLHHKCDPPLVHRNIDASSILLDDDFEVRLGRLHEVCTQAKETNGSRFSRGFERSISGTSDATCAYDVYCFGMVLLELVTGRMKYSLPNYHITKDSMPNTLSNVISQDKKLILNIVDGSLTIGEVLLKEIWAVAFVAKACLDPKPSRRPQMSHVLEALHNPSIVVNGSWKGKRIGLIQFS